MHISTIPSAPVRNSKRLKDFSPGERRNALFRQAGGGTKPLFILFDSNGNPAISFYKEDNFTVAQPVEVYAADYIKVNDTITIVPDPA